MLFTATDFQSLTLESLMPQIRSALNQLNAPGDLTTLQAAILCAAVNIHQPAIILDLGTGAGNSAAVFSRAAPYASIHTFDLHEGWQKAKPELEAIGLAPRNVTAHVGDATASSIADYIAGDGAVFVFWDMHGFRVAEWVLGHVLPSLADRRHIVICHDMTDNRYIRGPQFPAYSGVGLWQTMADFYKHGNRPYVTVEWAISAVDQVIPIFDFCRRNALEFHSVEHDWRQIPETTRETLRQHLGLTGTYASMGYFTMNDTERRYFPVFR